ncbi:hypothetical protein GOBAR_DD20245 [Gossypium barbadense]|nr:hypothetical protein GOBAR_DD20245 [Gossypium barbadense]
MESWQWAQYFNNGYRYAHKIINLIKTVNSVLRHTHHLPISLAFSATFYKLTNLIPKMGLRQAKQMEAGYVHIEGVKNGMEENVQRARSMDSYRVDLRNKRCE